MMKLDDESERGILVYEAGGNWVFRKSLSFYTSLSCCVDMAIWSLHINLNNGFCMYLVLIFRKFQIWQCVMSRGEWNKKEELLAEQAAKHLRQYTPLLAAFAHSAKAEMALLTKVIRHYIRFSGWNFLTNFTFVIHFFFTTVIIE